MSNTATQQVADETVTLTEEQMKAETKRMLKKYILTRVAVAGAIIAAGVVTQIVINKLEKKDATTEELLSE